MRIPTVLCLVALAACGNEFNNNFTNRGALLPTDALNVASFAITAASSDLTTQALDPSIEADLSVFEDDGCLQDATSPSPLDANVTAYTVTRTYSNCSNAVASATTGTRATTVTNANTIQPLLHSVYTLSLIQNDGTLVTLSSNTNVTLNGNAAMGTVSRVYNTMGTWNDPGSNIGVVQNFNNTFTLTDDFNTTTLMFTQTTLNGSFVTRYTDTQESFVATYTNVLFNPSTCCLPVGGTITETQSFGPNRTTTWAFSSTCGSFTTNGEPLTITDCP